MARGVNYTMVSTFLCSFHFSETKGFFKSLLWILVVELFCLLTRGGGSPESTQRINLQKTASTHARTQECM